MRAPALHIELLILGMSVLLGLVHIVAAAHSASLQRGYRWAASSRDQQCPPLVGVAGRLSRALSNFGETFPLFAALVFVVHATGSYGALSKWGAWLYLTGRVAYLPLYACDVYLARSLAWNVATVGIMLLLVSVLSS